MSVAIVVAMSKNRCIGKDNGLVWNHPEDTKRMKELTIGKTVIMGRKTWESIPEKYRPLPKRKNVVVTSQASYTLPDTVEKTDSVEGYIKSHANEELVIFGGESIYKVGLPFTDIIYLTEIDSTIEGDSFFPELNPSEWVEVERIVHQGFSFITLKRI